jgi:arsenate reductase-like glutaredoxin family protein
MDLYRSRNDEEDKQMAKSIDWYYTRNGCKTCNKTNAYIEEKNLAVKEEMQAKVKLGRDDALKLASRAASIRIAKGKKILAYDMINEPPGNDELLQGMLGPTGNLRAPAIIRGKTLLIGFNEEMYDRSLNG